MANSAAFQRSEDECKHLRLAWLNQWFDALFHVLIIIYILFSKKFTSSLNLQLKLSEINRYASVAVIENRVLNLIKSKDGV
jgi:hypothetical protein